MIKYHRKHVFEHQATPRKPSNTFWDRLKQFERSPKFSFWRSFLKQFLKVEKPFLAVFAQFLLIWDTKCGLNYEGSIILQKAQVKSFIYGSTLLRYKGVVPRHTLRCGGDRQLAWKTRFSQLLACCGSQLWKSGLRSHFFDGKCFLRIFV